MAMLYLRDREPLFQRGTVARSPQSSAYPHLWNGAVLLVAPGLGYQGRQLINWAARNHGLSRGTSVSTQALLPYGVIQQVTTATDLLWETDSGLGKGTWRRSALTIGVPTGFTTHVLMPHDDSLSLVNAGTIMAWGKMVLSNSGVLVSKGNENYLLEILTSGTVYFEWFNGIYRNLQFTVPNFNLNQWYHYAVTWDNLQMRAFRNGEQLGAAQAMPVPLVINTDDVALYRSPFVGNPFRGSIDDIRIYNRPLSPSDILTSYMVPWTPYRLRQKYQVFRGTIMMPTPAVRAQWQAQMTTIFGTTALVASPGLAQYQVQPGWLGRALATQPVRSQYQAQSSIISLSLMATPARIQYQAQAIVASRFAMPTPNRSVYQAQTPRLSIGFQVPAAQHQSQSLTPVTSVSLRPGPVQAVTYPAMTTIQGMTLVSVEPSRSQWRANIPVVTLHFMATPVQAQWQAIATPVQRGVMVVPAQAQYQALAPMVTLTIPERNLSAEYQAAFTNTAIIGDWLVQFPDLDLHFSFSYQPDATWIHRIITIADIEISAPPGGGIASVSNVSFRIAEGDSEDNVLTFWDLYGALQHARVTISFLLDGQPLANAFTIFTGYVDRVTFQDGVSEFLCVDDSIQRNLLVPRSLIKLEEFPRADRAVLTRPKPLVYGSGTYPASHPTTNALAAPLLLVDITNNIYLVADHAITLGGYLALYDTPTNLFLPLTNGFVSATSGVITLGTLDTGIQTIATNASVSNAAYATDGDPTTYAVVGTDLEDSGGDGIGFLHVTPGVGGYPNTTTIQITLTNHKRGPISDPTCTATFVFRTIDSRTQDPAQTFLSAGPFNHVTSAQTNIYTLSNVVIPQHELFDVYMLVRHTGMIGSVSNVYQIGEISITPLITYDATVSTPTTLIANPVPLQELRFNYLQPTLHIEWEQGVANASYAFDGNSLTITRIGTTVLDSNLDGIGELILSTSAVSSQRANNTLVVNFLNHRRNPSSAPTVTGTFMVQTLHPVQPATGGPVAVLRDNLFTTQSFRHVLNPQNTSFTAPSINLGASDRIGVRLLAREEGGVGSGTQTYDVGEVTLESFYQPRGDSQQLFLYGTTWAGRVDTTGALSYQGGAAPIGTLYHYADEVIASILVDELGLMLEQDYFYYAAVFYRTLGWFFDGGLGPGWAVERADARNILDDLAKQGACLLFPLYTGAWGIIAYGQAQTETKTFDPTTILLESENLTTPTPGQALRSSFRIDFGSLANVHTRFEVHYRYNPGSGKYDEVLFADQNSTNSPDGATLTAQCAQAYSKYGSLDPYVIQAYWITDALAAQYLLRHVVNYFSDLRLTVEFDVPIRFINLAIGEPIRVIYPLIPASECDGGIQSHGAQYETHSFRISPMTGRIHITASKKKIVSL